MYSLERCLILPLRDFPSLNMGLNAAVKVASIRLIVVTKTAKTSFGFVVNAVTRSLQPISPCSWQHYESNSCLVLHLQGGRAAG